MAHRLNLVLVKAATNSVQVRSFFGVLEYLCSFVAASPKRIAQLHKAQENAGKIHETPKALFDTRWATRANAVQHTRDNFEIYVEALEELIKTISLMHMVWSESFLQKALNLTEFDIHGDVYNDGSECKDPEKKTGDKYLYEEDWGEQKKELLHSAIVVVDIHREEVSIVDWLPKHISPGQAIWGPLDADNLSLIFVGWWTEPFKLGLVYCENRRSAIFQAKFNGSEPMCKQISADGCAAYSPCISPKGSKLVFLERDEGGPHRGCERLMMYNFESGSTPSPAYDIVQTASEAKEDISKDECFPDEIRSIAVAYVTEDVNNSLKEEILKIYQSLKRNGDAEKFYSAFYSLIVKNAKKYFSQLEMPVCTILASQLADKILAFYKKPVQQPVVVKPISEREFDGLQYLAGYVIHSLVRKYNRKTDSKSEAVQGVLLLLNSCRSDDISTQRLIQCQSRGGLWGVKREVIELFKLVEEEFRRETQSHVVSINCQEITQKLMKHIDITSLFNTIKEYDAHTLEKETSLSLLENMIKLYLRVRAFSITKTKTQLERKRVKGLRKGIKKSSDKDITGV
eukprot:gene7262-12949_t